MCLGNQQRDVEPTNDSAPEAEHDELRQIFAARGLADVDLERVVELITSDRERWLLTMLTEK